MADKQFLIKIYKEEERQPNGSTKPENKINKRVSLEINSEKRRVVGFFIYPEYEKAIDAIALSSKHKRRNKGGAIEYPVEFYLSHIPETKQKEILNLLEGADKTDEDEW